MRLVGGLVVGVVRRRGGRHEAHRGAGRQALRLQQGWGLMRTGWPRGEARTSGRREEGNEEAEANEEGNGARHGRERSAAGCQVRSSDPRSVSRCCGACVFSSERLRTNAHVRSLKSTPKEQMGRQRVRIQ